MQKTDDTTWRAAEARVAAQPQPEGVLPAETVGALFGAARRHAGFIAAWTVALTVLAALLITSVTPWYRSEAQVMLDTRQVVYAEMRAVLTGPSATAGSDAVRTEAEILQSPGLIRTVVSDLGLVDEPEFAVRGPLRYRVVAALADAVRWAADRGMPFGGAANWLEDTAQGIWSPPTDQRLFEAVVNAYRDRFSLRFDGRSYMITAYFEAMDPVVAAQVLNRHIDLYVENQRRMKADALRSASAWLDREISSLAGRLSTAELAVQEYRERNRLFSPRGTGLVAQEMADLNGQISVAQGEVARLAARAQRIRESGARGETLNEVVGSDNIGRLRLAEAEAMRREVEASAQLGAQHPTLVSLRAQRIEAQRKVQEEVQKVLQGVQGELAVAQARETSLRRAMEELSTRMAANEVAEVRARQLEREAQAVRALYESLLVRRQQVSAQEGIQQADARIVSPAVPPQGAAFPRTFIFLALAFAVSASSGVGIAIARERLRAGFGSIKDVEAGLGLTVLGALPSVPRRAPLARQVVRNPRSAAAESVRNLRHRLAVALPPTPPHIFVVTSALGGDGKTSVALALARSMASSGLAVLLIDGDLRCPSVSRAALGGAETQGVVAVIEARCPLDDAIRQDPDSPLRILAAEEGTNAPQDVLASAGFAEVLRAAALSFDCIIVDTPPAGAFSDAVLVARAATATILVVRCNRTPVDAAQAALRTLSAGGASLIAAVLNDVDLSKVPGYAPYELRRYGSLRGQVRA
ncbi:GumC family protein [Falsiroseomonas oryziterrae]|uniref:GumC family protein n=1 Tax=Falsiroseomonas oryziterrae TaxID=2911368 RepID=UPI001F3798C4|nr:polysaccharide biosynthesis tyrosine autokinase [Roseomonas sp. NPKOSM-4]